LGDLDTPELAGPSRFALLKSFLSLQKLKAVFTQSHANRGLERYRRAGITASSSFIAKALNILISFLSVPLTVHYLGAERYGVWLTISSLITWMSMTDFGLAGNALVNVLAETHGREDRKGAQQYSASAFWALSGISAVAGVICLASFRLIPWRAVFRTSAATSTHELQLAVALTLFFFVVNFPLSMQNSIYSAYQDGFLSNIWGIGTNSASLLALIFVSRTHGGLPQLVLALSGTRAFIAVINYVYMFRRYDWLLPVPSAVRWQCIKRLFSLGGKYLVTQLASLGIYQSQPIIITQMLGPEKVVIFVVAYKIIALPMDLCFMATQPFISAFGEARARELILLGEIVDADEALRIGLANKVVPGPGLEAAAAELAQRLAAQPPLALRGARQAIDAAWHRSPQESLRVALEAQLRCLKSEDFKEARLAMAEGRPPHWQGR